MPCLEGDKAEDMERAPQTWARNVAYGAFAVTIPSALWRVLMVAGALPGTEALRTDHLRDAGGPGYVFALSAVQLVAGALSLGLVQPWGERIAGGRLPTWLVAAVATMGALAVTALFTIELPWALLHGQRPDNGLVQGAALVLMAACYAPIALWGPLLLAATWGYVRRRSVTTSIGRLHGGAR